MKVSKENVNIKNESNTDVTVVLYDKQVHIPANKSNKINLQKK
jgi:hypothetical protein